MLALSLSTLATVQTIALVVLGIAVIGLTVWIVRLERRLHTLLKSGDGKSLESTVLGFIKEHDSLRQFQAHTEKYLQHINERLKRSVQSIETIRFNPFKGSGNGGNQSFATAFLNENGDGVIVSSLYARDRMSIFTKPVSQFASQHELSTEEQEVLASAKASLAKIHDKK